MTDTHVAPTTKPSPPKHASPDRAPWLVRAPNGLVRWLMRVGMPMGPNVPMTVRGRTSGLPRTTPVAVSEIDGRRYVIGAYGEVHWVRNLRAAGEATLRIHGSDVHVTATELDAIAARAFFADTVPSYIARFPWLGRWFLRVLFRMVAGDILTDPDKAASTRPVFELRVADQAR